MIFVLLFSFASCRKLEFGGSEPETEVYVTDADGNHHEVMTKVNEEGETLFYYVDNSGEEVTVKSNDIVVATKKSAAKDKNKVGTTSWLADIPEDVSLTPEEQSFLESFNDPESIDQFIDSNEPEPELELSDDIIDESKIKEIEVKVDSEGEPIHEDQPNGKDDYKSVLEGSKYTVSLNLKSNVNGIDTTIPITIYRDGDKFFIETKMPVEDKGSIKSNFLLMNQKCYMIIPSMRCYISVPMDSVSEIFSPEVFDSAEIESTFVSSGEISLDGKKYICDTYDADGQTVRYYYLDGALKRIETIAGEDNAIMEFKNVSTSVDSSKFKVPTTYFDMTKLMGSDADISDLL